MRRMCSSLSASLPRDFDTAAHRGQRVHQHVGRAVLYGELAQLPVLLVLGQGVRACTAAPVVIRLPASFPHGRDRDGEAAAVASEPAVRLGAEPVEAIRSRARPRGGCQLADLAAAVKRGRVGADPELPSLPPGKRGRSR